MITKTITVTRSGSGGAASVNYATVTGGTATAGTSCDTQGVDYLTTSGTLTFAPGETTKTFDVSVCSDANVENPETVNLRLSNAMGAALPSTPTTTLTIRDGGLTISGNIKQISNTLNPTSFTNLSGVSVRLSGTAPDGGISSTTRTVTTDSNGNYSFVNVKGGDNFVVTPTLSPFTFDPTTRTYNALAANVTNADFTAYRRVLQVVNSYPTTNGNGTTVAVPIVLTSQGDESDLAFSLNYGTGLSNPIVSCDYDNNGINDCSLTVNDDNPGRVGILVDNATFTPGTRLVVTVTFDVTTVTAVSNIPVTFGDDPTPRSTSNAATVLLSTLYRDGFVVFEGGLESDVAGRFMGNGVVNTQDIAQLRLFLAGTQRFNNDFNEFQRADAAPLTSTCKGDGVFNAADIAQARNYTLGGTANPPQTAGGPTQPLSSPLPSCTSAFAGKALDFDQAVAAPRTARVVSVQTGSSTGVTVSIEIDAFGNENVLSFSLGYDKTKLSNPQVVRGAAAQNASLDTNLNEDGFVGAFWIMAAAEMSPLATTKNFSK